MVALVTFVVLSQHGETRRLERRGDDRRALVLEVELAEDGVDPVKGVVLQPPDVGEQRLRLRRLLLPEQFQEDGDARQLSGDVGQSLDR